LRLAVALQAAEHGMHPSRRPESALDPVCVDILMRRTGGDDGAILLAEAGGEPVGYIAFYADCNDSVELRASAHRFLYVSDLCVVPAMRGRGIAGLLLAEAERWGRQLRLKRIQLGVLAANAAAQAAYRRVGYVPYE